MFAAVQDFIQLHMQMESWGQVPVALRRALTPDRTVRHTYKMLVRDYRMRIFMPRDSQYGAMYLCQQAHVDLAHSSTGGTSNLSSCSSKTARSLKAV